MDKLTGETMSGTIGLMMSDYNFHLSHIMDSEHNHKEKFRVQDLRYYILSVHKDKAINILSTNCEDTFKLLIDFYEHL